MSHLFRSRRFATIKPTPKITQSGFSNRTALIIIATCYPLGIISLSLVYVASNQLSSGVVSLDLAPSNSQNLTEQEAISIIQSWWNVRPKIFASPYDPSAAADVVADGPLWRDLNKSDGPVAWLRNNNQYYVYGSTSVDRVVSFDSSNSSSPSVVVTVSTNDTLVGPNINRPSSSTGNYRYTFAKENNKWKIWNYEKI